MSVDAMPSTLTDMQNSATEAPSPDGAQARQEQRYIGFMVAGCQYAFPIGRVREVRVLRQVTRVPGAPDHVRGLMDVHGEIIPLVDLWVRLGCTVGERPKHAVVLVADVVVGERECAVGYVADTLSEVHRVQGNDLESLQADGEDQDECPEFVTALIKLGDELAMVLDVDGLLDPTDFGGQRCG